eukprot:1161224-Pelagomonas_calceolata.AAC.2
MVWWAGTALVLFSSSIQWAGITESAIRLGSPPVDLQPQGLDAQTDSPEPSLSGLFFSSALKQAASILLHLLICCRKEQGVGGQCQGQRRLCPQGRHKGSTLPGAGVRRGKGTHAHAYTYARTCMSMDDFAPKDVTNAAHFLQQEPAEGKAHTHFHT